MFYSFCKLIFCSLLIGAAQPRPAKESLIRSSVGSVVELLKRRDCDQHGLGSKPTRAILLFPWKRHFTALPPTWRS